MGKKIYHLFIKYPQKQEFIDVWNGKANKQEIADYFHISVPSVKRIRNKLGLLAKNDEKHPYQYKLNKAIRKHFYKGCSTKRISKILTHKGMTMSDEGVRYRVLKMRLSTRPRSYKNVLVNDYRNNGWKIKALNRPPEYINKKIKLLLEQDLFPFQIAEQVGIGKDGVVRRLKAMGLRAKGMKLI